MLLNGEADIGLGHRNLGGNYRPRQLSHVRSWHHIVVPTGHPLIRTKPLTLAAIAEHSIITYHEGFAGRHSIEQAFTRGTHPDIIMSALDADVIKSYVEMGMGVGIIVWRFSAERDFGLQTLDGAHLFQRHETKLAVRKGNLLRHYRFRLCCPNVSAKSKTLAV